MGLTVLSEKEPRSADLYAEHRKSGFFSLAGFSSETPSILRVILDKGSIVGLLSSHKKWTEGEVSAFVPAWGVKRGYMRTVLPIAREFIMDHPKSSILISHVMVRHPILARNYLASKIALGRLGFTTTASNEYCDIVTRRV